MQEGRLLQQIDSGKNGKDGWRGGATTFKKRGSKTPGAAGCRSTGRDIHKLAGIGLRYPSPLLYVK